MGAKGVSVSVRTCGKAAKTAATRIAAMAATMTGEGEKFLFYAEQILKLSTEAREMVSGSAPKGTVAIGAPESLCVYRLPAVLREYRRRCPRVEIILKLNICADFPGWLKNNAVDVVFLMCRPLSLPGYMCETLLPEPMAVASGPDHPLVRKGYIEPRDLNGESLILTEPGLGYRAVLEEILTKEGVRPGLILEFGSVEAIKRCVTSGLGITFLPRVTMESELNDGRLVDLGWQGPEFNIVTQIALHKDKWITPALGVFLDLSREKLMNL
ncbi:MAG: LysR family transcriptional regulator substrate-binding protein [Peptococcaceae bacterium]|nr:LysR family transcriptional regulator substrate-binding protein [Peptococcaceae bacterium]